MERSGKFYRRNEAEVMKSLGLKPTKNSGSGWIEKEDGQSAEVICQLKSTDAESIRIRLLDWDTLSYNAAVAHKIPVFCVQFLKTNTVLLAVEPQHLQELAEYINTGKAPQKFEDFLGVEVGSLEDAKQKAGGKVIKSSENARKAFNSANEQKYKKKGKSAV